MTKKHTKKDIDITNLQEFMLLAPRMSKNAYLQTKNIICKMTNIGASNKGEFKYKIGNVLPCGRCQSSIIYLFQIF